MQGYVVNYMCALRSNRQTNFFLIQGGLINPAVSSIKIPGAFKRAELYQDKTQIMIKFADRFERFISGILLVFAMIIISYQVVQLIYNSIINFQKRFKEAGLVYAPEYGETIAILFFNVLLMIEIMQTIRVFAHNHLIKVKVILIVCLIAASRKILAVGEHSIAPLSELALAALILALATGYFLVSKTKDPVDEHEENNQK